MDWLKCHPATVRYLVFTSTITMLLQIRELIHG